MSWIDKQRRKEQLKRQVRQAMNAPEFKKIRQEERAEDIDNACRWFLTISVDYLYRHEGYGKTRMQRFVNFVNEQFRYIKDDPEYFKLLAHELEKETGINCLELGKGESDENHDEENTCGD